MIRKYTLIAPAPYARRAAATLPAMAREGGEGGTAHLPVAGAHAPPGPLSVFLGENARRRGEHAARSPSLPDEPA